MKGIKRYTVEEVLAEDRQIMGVSKWCDRDDVKTMPVR